MEWQDQNMSGDNKELSGEWEGTESKACHWIFCLLPVFFGPHPSQSGFDGLEKSLFPEEGGHRSILSRSQEM